MKPTPTLRQLRYLVAVSENRHFGRAAEACLVTQSTLSVGIQDLEALLGVTLIERSKRSVTMTALGLDMTRRARGILRAAEEMTEAAQAAGRPFSGDLRLGVIPTIGPYLLPGAIKQLRATYPDLKILLREQQSADCLDALEQGQLDLVILALPYDTPGLETFVIAGDGLVVAMPKDHRWAGRQSIEEGELADEPLLMLEDGHCLRDHALAACQLGRAERNEVFQATSMNTLVQMVVGGLGITLLPQIAAGIEAAPGRGLVTVPIKGATRARDLALCWRHASPRGADYTAIGNLLKKHLAGQAGTQAGD